MGVRELIRKLGIALVADEFYRCGDISDVLQLS
jgi:hypothetical protein